MTAERRYAVKSRTDGEAGRIAYMLKHMAHNKAYSYAVAACGGDPDGAILGAHRERFLAYRQAWRGNPKKAIDSNLTHAAFAATGMAPLCVDIETAAVCDLACSFCFRQHIVTPDKIMRPELYFRIIDQCEELGVPSIKLNWRGEPLLHPKLPELVDYAKRHGVLEVIINTNAVTLDEAKARALIDSGLDLLIYSFDGGSKHTYEMMRPGRFKENTFDQVYANIRAFAELKQEMGSPLPRTKIQMILMLETFEEQDSFFALFEDCVDDVSVKAYTERGGRLPDLDEVMRRAIEPDMAEHGIDHNAAYWRDLDGNLFVSKGRLPCEQPFQRLIVTYDGRVSMCCYDWGSEYPVGYVDEEGFANGDDDYEKVMDSIKAGKTGFAEHMATARMPKRYVDPPKIVETLGQIWHGAIINEVREKHICGRLEDVPICTRCPFKETYHWLKVEGSLAAE